MSNRKVFSIALVALVAALFLACAMFFTACNNDTTPGDGQDIENPDEDGNNKPNTDPDDDKDIAVTSVALDKTELMLKVDETYTLTVTIMPADATNKNIIWESSAPSVADVSKGTVTALSAGIATISATSANGKSSECAVTVTSEDEAYFIASYDTITGVTPEGRKQTQLEIPSVMNGTCQANQRLCSFGFEQSQRSCHSIFRNGDRDWSV